jgi:hypothetical protein
LAWLGTVFLAHNRNTICFLWNCEINGCLKFWFYVLSWEHVKPRNYELGCFIWDMFRKKSDLTCLCW